MTGTFIASLSLVLLCSCATQNAIHVNLPADAAINKSAGYGDVLLTTIRMEGAGDLLFLIDTGTPVTLLDKSLEPRLGKSICRTRFKSIYGKSIAMHYRAPKFFLGGTQLQMGDSIATSPDVKRIASDLSQMTHTNRPIMGILGMACLKHYCLQLDFAARKLRFIDPGDTNHGNWGTAFRLSRNWNDCFTIAENLAGVKGPGSLIDTGDNNDGWLTTKLFQQWTNQVKPPASGEVRSPQGTLGGEKYPAIFLSGDGSEHKIGLPDNGIGLHLLARHLVTFDFPNRTMYLKRMSIGPPVDLESEAAEKFVKSLLDKNQLPGFAEIDQWRIQQALYPISGIIEVFKRGDSGSYHYAVARGSANDPWQLQKAWRTDAKGQIVEEFPVP